VNANRLVDFLVFNANFSSILATTSCIKLGLYVQIKEKEMDKTIYLELILANQYFNI